MKIKQNIFLTITVSAVIVFLCGNGYSENLSEKIKNANSFELLLNKKILLSSHKDGFEKLGSTVVIKKNTLTGNDTLYFNYWACGDFESGPNVNTLSFNKGKQVTKVDVKNKWNRNASANFSKYLEKSGNEPGKKHSVYYNSVSENSSNISSFHVVDIIIE